MMNATIPSANRPQTRSAGAVHLREATFDDYTQITALERRCGLEDATEEHWRRIWKDNPAHCQGWPIGWVLERSDGAIVGHFGHIPLPYEFNGKELQVSTGRGWAVDPEYRQHSLGLLQRFFSQREGLQLFTTVSPVVANIMQRFGAKRVPVGNWDRAAFWVTNYSGFAASLLADRRAATRQLLRYPMAGALFLRDRLGARPTGKNNLTITINSCSEFDDRFDDLWGRLQSENRNRLLAVRNAKALRWHYRYRLSRNDIWIAAASKNHSLVGYMTLVRHDSAKRGLKRMRIVDFQALEEYRMCLIPLLSWTLNQCKMHGIHMLEEVGNTFGDKVDGMVVHTRNLPCWAYFYKTEDASLAGILEDPQVWKPCLYDGDASL